MNTILSIQDLFDNFKNIAQSSLSKENYAKISPLLSVLQDEIFFPKGKEVNSENVLSLSNDLEDILGALLFNGSED